MKFQSIVIVGISLATSALSGCADQPTPGHQSQVDAPKIPEVAAPLRVPPTQVLTLETSAVGVQIYECGSDKNDNSRFTWNFKAPEADLFDAHTSQAGKQIGKHYAGPTWEGSDGSKVIGQVMASENSPDPTAIAWLLLSAKSNSGSGIFSKTSSVQRLNTSGGKAPTDGCDQTHLGTLARVPYTAQYYFYN